MSTDPETASQLREFLTRLAQDNALLLRYINDPNAVLQDERNNSRLSAQAVDVLRNRDYAGFKDLMSLSPGDPLLYPTIWNTGSEDEDEDEDE